jgi:hypothetical protein
VTAPTDKRSLAELARRPGWRDRPKCRHAACDRAAVVVHHNRGRTLTYCKVHATIVRDVLGRRIVPLIRCDLCSSWRALDLELRRGTHVRSLCAVCAELVDNLVEGRR